MRIKITLIIIAIFSIIFIFQKIETSSVMKNKNLTKVELRNMDLSNLNLSGVDFRNNDLTGVALFNSNLSGADLSGVDLSNKNLNGADLSNANLSGANLNNTTFVNASLFEANLQGASLSGTNFSQTDIRYIDLTGVNLTGVDLRNMDLTGVNLTGVDLRNMDLTGVNLTGVDLRNMDLTGVNLTGVDLRNMDLTGTILKDSVKIEINLNSPSNSKWPKLVQIGPLNKQQRLNIVRYDFNGNLHYMASKEGFLFESKNNKPRLLLNLNNDALFPFISDSFEVGLLGIASKKELVYVSYTSQDINGLFSLVVDEYSKNFTKVRNII